ncbi:tetratricopeptide repeat protein [uncultured Hyphomicrobium sp.]|uniref:CHAT domain-containing tetratricopeptide repeat protein n=1 Tax=uncultured Hyphomicrobium sp. TaxID=194373 RepID=UPI0025D3ECD7|nr:tetratricopeptide repeat protein [uncultured Hyphomicrobium sp.]
MLWKRIAGLVALMLLACWTSAAPASDDLDQAQRANEEGVRLYEAGQYDQAEALYKQSLADFERLSGPDHLDVATSLANLALLYYSTDRGAEAESLWKRSLAIREKELGPEHIDVATSLANLALLYQSQNRAADVEPLLKRSIAIREKAIGPDDISIARLLDGLAWAYDSEGRAAETEQLMKRALSIREKEFGKEHAEVGATLYRLAGAYMQFGRFADAEVLLKRLVAVRERDLGPDHADVGAALSALGIAYQYQMRSADAEPVLKRALAIQTKALGPEHPDVAGTISALSVAYEAQGRYADAIALTKQSLAIQEKAKGPDHLDVAVALNNLAGQYEMLERYAEAEALYKRALAIGEKAPGAGERVVAVSLSSLADLYKSQERYQDAEPLHKRSIAILEKVLPPNHPDLATAISNLAFMYLNQDLYPQAEVLLKRAIGIYEKSLDPDHYSLAMTVMNLATAYDGENRHDEALTLLKRSLASFEKSLGPEHPHVAGVLDSVARNALYRGDIAEAVAHWRRATEIIRHRAERGLGGASAESGNEEAQRTQPIFGGLVKAIYRLHAANEKDLQAAAFDTFLTAQWGRSADAASSLAQMTARSAQGSPEMASLVRERQDLVSELQSKDQRLVSARGEPPETRDAKSEQELSERIRAIDARLAAIDARLTKDFPSYAALVNPKPLTVSAVQSRLHDNEALVMFLATAEVKPIPEETFVWIVTKSGVRWLRSEFGGNGLAREVAALRCGLDQAAWQVKETDCAKLTGTTYTKADSDAKKPLPFDTGRSHAFYKSLLSGAEDLIRDKQLLIVPSAALSQLPFQVLVTAPPEQGKPTAWLVREHALTVLPSVASLDALRSRPRPAAVGRKPYLAFANPLLEGKAGDPFSRRRAESAARSSDCAAVAAERTLAEAARSFAALDGDATLGAAADVDALRRLMPVPQTAALVCDVRQAVGADEDDIHLAGRATETEIKAMNAKGALASYAVVNFATHGLVAGALKATAEPGLVLTPPASGTPQDDGYLSASEVAALNLDADWVILSACNTAAGGAKDAVALSGLARSFFYAGARALLVSHWAVWEKAAVQLVTGAIAAGNAGVGRAEAMRRSMLALADTNNASISHPSYWAPFVVVGEGGAAPSPTTMKGAQ